MIETEMELKPPPAMTSEISCFLTGNEKAFRDNPLSVAAGGNKYQLLRAVGRAPRSFKLWKKLLLICLGELGITAAEPHILTAAQPLIPSRPDVIRTLILFEKASLSAPYPSVFLLYLSFLSLQLPLRISHVRRVVDRAMAALPTTQHPLLYASVQALAVRCGGVSQLVLCNRLLKVSPSSAFSLAQTLSDPLSACKILSLALTSPRFNPTTTTPFEIYSMLANTISTNPTLFSGSFYVSHNPIPAADAISSPSELLSVDSILRTGINRFPNHSAFLWSTLATYYIHNNNFTKARLVYNEALSKVSTVKDFSIIFDAYAKMEEDIIQAIMKNLNLIEDSPEEDSQEDPLENSLEDLQEESLEEPLKKSFKKQSNPTSNHESNSEFHEETTKNNPSVFSSLNSLDEIDLEIHIARFESLISKRPLLVSDTLLRQNPHNVEEWINRSNLFLAQNNLKKTQETFAIAVDTVHPQKAHGHLHDLWSEYAKFAEKHLDNVDLASSIFERAASVHFANVDHLASIYCEWAELLIRHNNIPEAIAILARATAPPPGYGSGSSATTALASIRYNDSSLPIHTRIFKSPRIWSLLIDLEESTGTLESTKSIYARIIALKIATPQHYINYAEYLQSHNFHDESFRVYESALSQFSYPTAFEIVNIYLTKFVERYAEFNMPRVRDLFESVLESCPPEQSNPIYILYSNTEDKNGSPRNALKILDRAITVTRDGETLYTLYTMLIQKTGTMYGISSTRPLYTRALETLPDLYARKISHPFIRLEISLGDIVRARSIYTYVAGFSDPAVHGDVWSAWHEFEVRYGNEDTYREMLRVKRSVVGKLGHDVVGIGQRIVGSGVNVGAATSANPIEQMEMDVVNEGDGTSVSVAQGASGTRVIGFVASSKPTQKRDVDVGPTDLNKDSGRSAVVNPDQINMSDDDDDENDDDQDDADIGIVKRDVPVSVYGSVMKAKDGDEDVKTSGIKRKHE